MSCAWWTVERGGGDGRDLDRIRSRFRTVYGPGPYWVPMGLRRKPPRSRQAGVTQGPSELVANLHGPSPALDWAHWLMVHFDELPRPAASQVEFLRARLALLAKFLCTFTLLSIGIVGVAGALVPPLRHPAWPFDAYTLFAAVISLIFGLTWALTRSRIPGVLLVLDVLTATVTAVVIGMTMVIDPEGDPSWKVFGVTLVLSARAAMLPSTTSRTFWLGIVSAAAAVGCSYLALAHLRSKPDPNAALAAATTGAIFLLLSTLVQSATSKVIYGLRKEVHTAEQLGQYTLVAKLGEGGMGAVYRARHALLRRPTAVKLLLPNRTREHDVERFEREVQKTASLTHPNTVTVYDYGCTHDGIFYYAMEYLDGASLHQVVEVSGAQPAERVAWILRQVAGALVEAHQVGLIHRDIKPANIILCEQGCTLDVAKVVDFGLVKDISPVSRSDLTHRKSLTGTPLFLAPEALTDPDELDGRSDLYALGAVGYYLLTGELVFDGKTIVEVCGHHLHTQPEPPSARLGRELPGGLEALLLACLEKDPNRRPQSAGELVSRLDATGLVEQWTQTRARQWWVLHGPAIRALQRSQTKSASYRPLAIDLRRLRSRLRNRTETTAPRHLDVHPTGR